VRQEGPAASGPREARPRGVQPCAGGHWGASQQTADAHGLVATAARRGSTRAHSPGPMAAQEWGLGSSLEVVFGV